MISIKEITTFIDRDRANVAKKRARIGQRYYEGRHDIADYRLFYYDSNGMLQEDTMRSNIKISHPFFTELVDQAVQYMLSGMDSFVRSDDPKLQRRLDEYFNDNEDFTAELYDVLVGTLSKGYEYMYVYKDKNDRIAFQWADSMGVIEIGEKESPDGIPYIIYYYTEIVGDVPRMRVLVWTQTHVHYYVKPNEKPLEFDTSEAINPRPHTIYTDANGDTYYETFGFIPFFRLDYNRRKESSLTPIKELIDDYDLMSCGLSNNLQDANEYLVVVSGFQGNNLDELMANVKTKKHIGVNDGGGVEFKTVSIPYDARKVKLELDEKNIYRFGMGFNSSQIGDGNITNIVIKSRYTLLDLKCNALEIRLRQFLRKLLTIVLEEINAIDETAYSQRDVYLVFNREIMANETDNATIGEIEARTRQTAVDTLMGLVGTLDDETILMGICDVLDVDYEEVAERMGESPMASVDDALAELAGVIPDERTAT